MTLARDQELVLETIARLGNGNTTSPVTISAIHHAFSDMDVRDLVVHLGVLIDQGLITNAGTTREKIGNRYVITPKGLAYGNRDAGKHS